MDWIKGKQLLKKAGGVSLDLAKKGARGASDIALEIKRKSDEHKERLEIEREAHRVVNLLKDDLYGLDDELVSKLRSFQGSREECYFFGSQVDCNEILREQKQNVELIEQANFIVNRLNYYWLSGWLEDSELGARLDSYDEKKEECEFFLYQLDSKALFSELRRKEVDSMLLHYTTKSKKVGINSSTLGVLWRELRRSALFQFTRNTIDLSEREIVCLKLLVLIEALSDEYDLGDIEGWLEANKLSIIYNSGECEVEYSNIDSAHDKWELDNALKKVGQHPSSSVACSEIIRFALSCTEFDDGNEYQIMIKSLITSSNTWFDGTEENAKLNLTDDLDEALAPFQDLLLGKLVGANNLSGDYLHYSGEGSLVTIAGPGGGKTQSNVLLNLFRFNGPAIVLDIKGKCYETTASWREEHVGPVFKFSPFSSDSTCLINPLMQVRPEFSHILEDSHQLASMLIMNKSDKDPFWEDKAKQLVASIIACLVLDPEFPNPTIQDLQDVLASTEDDWQEFVKKMDGMGGFETPRSLSREANIILNTSESQRATIINTARSQLFVWDMESIVAATSETNFDVTTLRDDKTTLYISIPQEKVSNYSSVIKVILTSLLNPLRQKVPSRDKEDILFFLDEFPQLGRMKPIEEALELGREYKLKLWFFAQNEGQLQAASANPTSILDNCDVQIYMNPTVDVAARLSQQLGMSESIISGQSEKLATASELMGEIYADRAIIFVKGNKPIRVEKLMSYQVHADLLKSA